jgi:hypothetical protein
MIVGNVTVFMVGNLAGCMAECVPDGTAFTVFVPRAFDLMLLRPK